MKAMERVFILVMILFSGAVILEGKRLPLMSEYTIGPGFLPQVIGVSMFIIATAMFLQSVMKHKGETGEKAFVKREGAIRLCIFILVLLISLLLNKVLGLVIPLIFFMIIIFQYIEKYSWLTSIKVAVMCNIILYLIFQTWLGVPLPGINL